MRESKESIQSWVSSGSMSGSWVGSHSWMTVGMAPLRCFSVLDVGVSSTVTCSSLHAPDGQKIYRPVDRDRGLLHAWTGRTDTLSRGQRLRPRWNSGGLLPTSYE